MKLHLAGIIPVANLKTDFNLDIPSCMMPGLLWLVSAVRDVFCLVGG